MADVFITNCSLGELSDEFIERIKNNDEEALYTIQRWNAYNNSKISYILKHGMPTSFVKRLV